MNEKKKKIITVLIMAAVLAFTVLICVFIGRPLIKFVTKPEQFRRWVDSHGFIGKLAFVGMIVFQVIIAVIPGEPFEMGGGYAFGTLEGTLLTLIGILIGSAVIFALVRTLGVKVVEIFFPIEKIRSLKFLKDSKKLNILTFVIMLLPGTPKDLISYFMGLTEIKFSYWMFVVAFARLPSIITSTAAGDALGFKNYKLAVIFVVSTIIISLLGLIYYRIITKREQKWAEKEK